MPGSTRGLPARLLALAVLLVVAGTLAAGVAVSRHQHDGPGVYDNRCPLEGLAALDRAGCVATAPSGAPVALAAALVLLLLVVRPALAPATDARLRAPPSR